MALAGLSLAGVSSMESTHLKLKTHTEQQQLKSKSSEVDTEARMAKKKGKTKTGEKSGMERKREKICLLSEG